MSTREDELDLEMLAIVSDLAQRFGVHPDETISEIGHRAAAAGDPVALVLAGESPQELTQLAVKEQTIRRLRAAMSPERHQAVYRILAEMRSMEH